jgi:hypothetical protein
MESRTNQNERSPREEMLQALTGSGTAQILLSFQVAIKPSLAGASSRVA